MLVADTSVLVEYLRGNKAVARFLKAQDQVAVSALVAWELWKGAHTPRRQAAVQSLLGLCAIEPFTASHAQLAGTMARDASRAGHPRPALDLLVASHAVTHGCALATLDGDYEGIPGLKVVRPG